MCSLQLFSSCMGMLPLNIYSRLVGIQEQLEIAYFITMDHASFLTLILMQIMIYYVVAIVLCDIKQSGGMSSATTPTLINGLYHIGSHDA